MANRSILTTATMALTLLATVPGTLAQSNERVGAAASVSGISTDGLTAKQLRIWRKVERIAEAEDKGGRPLFPMLLGLMQWAKGNGHTIAIEMEERRASTNMGGNTTLEQGDSIGLRRTATLWLHIWAIDNASVNRVLSASLQTPRNPHNNQLTALFPIEVRWQAHAIRFIATRWIQGRFCPV